MSIDLPLRPVAWRGLSVGFSEYRIVRRRPGLHYYELRHTPDPWYSTAWLERRVAIGRRGTVVSPVAIDLGPEGGLVLTAEEMIAFGLLERPRALLPPGAEIGPPPAEPRRRRTARAASGTERTR